MPTRLYGETRDPNRNNSKGSRSTLPYGLRQEPKPKKEDPTPNHRLVEQFHKNADTNTRKESIHHTLGPSPSQASPGDHNHEGGSSRKLLEGYNLSGSKTTPATMWPSILQCLVRLGAKDSTTA